MNEVATTGALACCLWTARQYNRAMLGEPDNQLSLTLAALSKGGRKIAGYLPVLTHAYA